MWFCWNWVKMSRIIRNERVAPSCGIKKCRPKLFGRSRSRHLHDNFVVKTQLCPECVSNSAFQTRETWCSRRFQDPVTDDRPKEEALSLSLADTKRAVAMVTGPLAKNDGPLTGVEYLLQSFGRGMARYVAELLLLLSPSKKLSLLHL